MSNIEEISVYAKHVLLQLPHNAWNDGGYMVKRAAIMIQNCQETYDGLLKIPDECFGDGKQSHLDTMLEEKKQWETIVVNPLPYLEELVAAGWAEKNEDKYRQVRKNNQACKHDTA